MVTMLDTKTDPTVSADVPVGARSKGEAPLRLARGMSLGRYVVLDRLGAGGMGVVYRAYDPELHRQVAIKVLLPSRAVGTEGASRMHREAQAMAQVSHSNVVTIHDVGSVDDHIYIAMELVSGQTLARWRYEAKPGWREVLLAYVSAGRGLAAAHTEGLVHRDFKPDNVMIDASGHVRVMDFGLARAVGTQPRPIPVNDEGITLEQHDSLSDPLTHDGALMGTPAYMAPEQFTGLEVDERADQFSFCIAVWEGIYGERPFVGGTAAEIGALVTRGELSSPEMKVELPAAVDQALRKGLSPEPEDRWPSLEELLDVLELSLAPRRRRWVMPAFTVLLAGSAVAAAYPISSNDRCSGGPDEIAEVWNEARAEAVAERFRESRGEWGTRVWTRERGRLDAYVERWTEKHRAACEATTRGEQSDAVLDLRMACLRRAKLEVDAGVGIFGELGDLDRAYAVVSGLPPLEHCEDVDALREGVAPPPDALEGPVDAVRAKVSRAMVLVRAGRYSDASELIAQAEEAADGLDYEPVLTEVFAAKSRALRATSKLDEAVVAGQRTMELAARNRQWRELDASMIELIYVVGYLQSRPDEAMLTAKLALGFAGRGGDSFELAHLHSVIGSVHHRAGRFEEAIAENMLALEIGRRVLPEGDIWFADPLDAIGNAAYKRSGTSEARPYLEESIALISAALGDDHPRMAITLNTLGAFEMERGHAPEAEQHYRRALEINEAALRPGHPHTSMVLNNLATSLGQQGKLDEAVGYFRRVVDETTVAYGPKHPQTSIARFNIANALTQLDRPDEAEPEIRRSLSDLSEVLGEDHVRVAKATVILGKVLLGQGKNEAAVAEFRKALSIYEEQVEPASSARRHARRSLARGLAALKRYDEAEAEYLGVIEDARGLDEGAVGAVRQNLGALYLNSDRPELAREQYERAYELLPGGRGHAFSAFGLAQALPESERRRARELANEALELLEGDADADPKGATAKEIRVWLRAHR